jgi:hypothetical protein
VVILSFSNFLIYKDYIYLALSIIKVRRVVILEEFLAARPRHHRQRIIFLKVTAAADIILPLIDLCFCVSLTYICHLYYGFHDCTYWMYFMIVLMDGYFYIN